MNVIDCSVSDPFAVLRKRGIHRDSETERVVRETIEDVRQRGDDALLENARKYDAPELQSISVSTSEIESASLPEHQAAAIEKSIRNSVNFHAEQKRFLINGFNLRVYRTLEERQSEGQLEHSFESYAYWWRLFGGFKKPPPRPTPDIGQQLVPLRRVGAYVPGGAAAYPSSVIMNVIPAQAASVDAIFVATPARKDGTLHQAVLFALRHCGVVKTFKIGGAAAIAAMALGTELVPRVDKIVGPGNRFVNEAKRQLWGTVGLDGYAGPSEVCILADDEANARFAAADLLTQVEHAPDNAGFLVTLSRAKHEEIMAEVELQLAGAPREETMRKALANESMAFIARDLQQACEIVDAIAPEHLSIATRNPEKVMEKIHNAGCILLGEWTAESAGDFCMGPSHTLPTSGAARFGSPVNVLDFLKVQSVARLTREDLYELLPTIEAFGEMEGFPTHARGASIRFE